MIWDSSWAYSKTSIWKLLSLKVTNKWPWMILIKLGPNKSLYEDGQLHQNSSSSSVCFSATSSVCFSLPTLSFHVGIHSRTLFIDERTETQRCYTTSPGSHSCTATEPGWKHSSSDFQPLCFCLNHIHFININVVEFSFVKSKYTLD